MRSNKVCIIRYWLGLFLFSGTLWGQADYDAFFQAMNPVVDSLPPQENRQLLADFLAEAEQATDTLKIIHGQMYLAQFLMQQGKFVEASKHLLEAEEWASIQANKRLLGRIEHRKGGIQIRLRDYPQAVAHLESAVALTAAAQDSQYLGLSYEQLGAAYGYQGEYEKAVDTYEKALSLIARYGNDKQLAVSYANFGNVLSAQGHQLAAIEQYEHAITINRKLADWYQLVPAMQNLAGELLLLDEYERAYSLYYQCLALNKQHGWKHYLIYTYQGLYAAHNDQGHLDSAYHYYRAYQELKDSVIGGEVRANISEMEATIALQEKEIALLAQKELTARQKKRAREQALLSTILLLVTGMVGLVFYLHRRKSLALLRENRANLHRMVQLLQVKNAELRELKAQTDETEDTREEEDEIDLLNTRILTPDDWQAFKELFEKSYPGFLHRLRFRYPGMSEAEERLFLLLKLKLNSREIANTLGIQAESVKKSRTRLRRRLQLERSDSLERFIYSFSEN